MADEQYKRLDIDQLNHLLLYLLTKLKNSSLNSNTTYTVTQDSTDGHKFTFTGSDGSTTTVTIPDNNTEYSNATTEKAGLMSSTDKQRLENLVTTGGEANLINTVEVNGTALVPDDDKAVNVTIATGTANGTVAVNGADVKVKGLGSAAYTESSAYDKAGAASDVLGTSADTSASKTVYGAIALANSKQDPITIDSAVSTSSKNPVQNAVITAEVNKKANSADLATVATSGKYSDLSGTPTNVSAFTNDAGYQTAAQVQTIADNTVAKLTKIQFSVLAQLPETGTAGTFYLIKKASSSNTKDVYDEYIWDSTTSSFERLGDNEVDLSGYVKTSQMVVMTNTEIETAVDTAYTAVFGASA